MQRGLRGESSYVRLFALHGGLFESWMDCVDSEKAKGNDFVETCMTQVPLTLFSLFFD